MGVPLNCGSPTVFYSNRLAVGLVAFPPTRAYRLARWHAVSGRCVGLGSVNRVDGRPFRQGTTRCQQYYYPIYDDLFHAWHWTRAGTHRSGGTLYRRRPSRTSSPASTRNALFGLELHGADGDSV